MYEVNVQEPHPLDAISDVPSEPQEYIPSKSCMLKEYEITIQFMSRGCVIRIGCKSIPFESVELAMTHLTRYVNEPYTTRKEWEKVLD
jgi:hypothetical protein